jgi:choline dehydrogenase-like flavoprotein
VSHVKTWTLWRAGECDELRTIPLKCPRTREAALIQYGSVLGGGTAVNSALWWKPHPRDWDVFPDGWKNADMEKLVDRVWETVPDVSFHPRS